MFHLSQMDQIFLKSLTDVVRLSRSTNSYDQLTLTTQIITDVKSELQSKAESVRLQALLKLFFLSMEGNSIKWAEFLVINLMGAQELPLKLTAFLAAHLVIDHQSQGLIMVTNLFQKELKSNYVECSCALSCLGTIANKELTSNILTQVVSLTTHSKPIVRKKAIAVLCKIFTLNPNSIPGNLEKIIAQLQKESNTAVLAAGISLFFTTMKAAPSLYPLFLKLVLDLISVQKSNWLLIKLVQISNRLIDKEPRFQGKLIEHYTRLLNQTNSKSLQYELTYSIMKYFKNHQTLYDSAGDILRQFLNHPDANLRSLGLNCLTNISTAAGLQEFQDQILDSFKKGDYFYKIQILQLFKEYTTNLNFQKVIEFFLQNSDLECNYKIIENLLYIIQKDRFVNVSDPEKLLLNYLPQIANKIDTNENAVKFRDVIVDLLARVPDLKQYSDKLCYQILQNFQLKNSNLQGPTLNIVQRHTELKYQLNHREIIFKTLIMITGESTKLIQFDSLFCLLKFLSTSSILQQYESSLPEMDFLLFKIHIQLAQQLKQQQNEENLIEQVQSHIQSIYTKLWQNNIIKTKLFYESLIENKSIQEIADLSYICKDELPPINYDAQQLVKRPEGLILEKPFTIDLQEIETIKALNQENQLQQTTSVEQQQSQQQQQQQQQSEQEQTQNEKNDIEVPIKSKPTLQINREDVLPPGVTQNDINKFKEEQE